MADIKDVYKKAAEFINDFKKEHVHVKRLEEDTRMEKRWVDVAKRRVEDLDKPEFALRQEVPSQYHLEKLEQFEKRMVDVAGLIDKVEEYLRVIDQHSDQQNQRQMLQQVLRNQHDALIGTAGRVGKVHGDCDQIRDIFIDLKPEQARRLFEPPPAPKQSRIVRKKAQEQQPQQQAAVAAAASTWPAASAPTPSTTTTSNGFGFGTPSTPATNTSFGPGTLNSTTPFTPAPSSGGFGFGATAAGFGATPAANPSTPSSTFGSFTGLPAAGVGITRDPGEKAQGGSRKKNSRRNGR